MNHSKFSDFPPCFCEILGRNFLSLFLRFVLSWVHSKSFKARSESYIHFDVSTSVVVMITVVTEPKFTFPVFFASRRSHQSGLSSTVCESVLYLQHFPQELLLPPRIGLVSAFSRQCWRCVLLQMCALFLMRVKSLHDFITLLSLNNLLPELKFWEDRLSGILKKKKNCWFNATNVLDKLILF